MKIVRGTKNIRGPLPYPVMTLGNFDGVHVGHQILFRKAAEIAMEKEGTSIAFTFEPHPLKIIAPEKVPPLLTHFHKKKEVPHSDTSFSLSINCMIYILIYFLDFASFNVSKILFGSVPPISSSISM